MKKQRLAIIIALILFFVPFFWLEPGEMNLGGDSGRLYFYDPATYLNLHVFYNYLKSGNGIELTYYIFLPYVTLLFLLKSVFQSSTLLISLFNGLTLSIAFFSVYLIVKELLTGNDNIGISRYRESAAILAGLFYILSQISIYSGWEKPIITFYQVFLNPFMAFLTLKFMLTQKIKYLIVALLTTFVFAPNFSIIGAPPFFAFYPITILFLFIYATFIRGVSIKWRFFFIGIVLFLCIQAFHLVSTVGSIFSAGSSANLTVFAQEGVGSRYGLDYFISVAGGIKVSRIWMSLAQIQDERYLAVFIIFPAILALSFLINRGRTLLLTGLFFIVTLYFTSAITETGFFVYKQLFKIPGFSMFRNFHGQWSYVFFFFYSLLFGQAIAIVASKCSKRIALLLFTILGTIIVGFGLPLLSGTVPMPTNKDTGIKSSFRMDPVYEQALQYFKSDPVDGKVLMFPLTDPGYQVFQGKDGGIYRGLPMISYLGSKSEFGGYETLGPFKNIFMTSMQSHDFETLEKLFSILNIKWIFYNSDPYIYSEPFNSLYGFVSQYAPKDPKGYREFIEKLPITKLVDFGNTYHIYSVKDDIYVPHIFATQSVNFTNNASDLVVDSNFQREGRHAILPVQGAESGDDSLILHGFPKTFFTELKNNSHFHTHEPFIKRKLSYIFYPFVVVKEQFVLWRKQQDYVNYINSSFLFLMKRIIEMERFGKDMDIISRAWKEPKLWEVHKWQAYNSLTRYEKEFEDTIEFIEKAPVSDEQRIYNELKIKEQLHKHELILLRSIRELDKKAEDKTYLLFTVNSMFERLYEHIHMPIIDPSLYVYRLPTYDYNNGVYDVYLGDKNASFHDPSQITLTLGDQIVKPISQASESGLLLFKGVRLDNKKDIDITVTMPVDDIAQKTSWNKGGDPFESTNGVMTMVLNNTLDDFAGGVTLEIPHWVSKSKYLISFDYNTNGKDFVFSFFIKNRMVDPLKKTGYQQFFEKRLYSQGFKTQQSFVYSEEDNVGGFLKIVPFYQDNASTIQIKNLVIQKIDHPQLVFKKIIPEENKNLQLPHITFRRVNPTRYVLDIKDAVNPYTLVFLESFNTNWKLFDPESNTNSVRGSVSRLLGRVGKLLITPFARDETGDTTIVASYFNGEVEEARHTYKFLEPGTFKTWGKNTIADHTHTFANAYANAWHITPQDMNGKTDYTLVLELSTQKRFYATLLLSLITVIVLIGYLIKSLLWPRKH